ncbi:MAG TPA: choice-of-anchor tandem repeat GloVer-containing protein [Terriglobales bacterium]|jgi:uncharacterized repeat protein (TIGR03803 family)|nr:choice-of-anchor tandem repeat GloVer-containing protein [Terriglobales bacterium]
MEPMKQLQSTEPTFQIGTVVLMLAFLILSATITPSARAQTYSVLHRFSGQDGEFPQGRLTLDTTGHGYGTAMDGGANGYGTLFTLSSKQQTIYSFTGSGGSYPLSGVTRDTAGNLYTTNAMGGNGGCGTVIKLDTKGNETVLYSFYGGSDGDQPQSALSLDSAGNLYGTTVLGGSHNMGTVFEISASGSETVLHAFSGGEYDGAYPYYGLNADPSGNFYGTTGSGGSSAWGTVFKISAAGNYSTLYSFTGGLDGGHPKTGLHRDNAGNLYGTTKAGGAFGNGTVFELDAKGIETVLYSFTGGADGSQPEAGVLEDAAGNLYGTTVYGGVSSFGTVFKLDQLGNETVLHSFEGGSDGQYPHAPLVQDAKGNLYGTTSEGGATYGTIFKIAP